MTTSGIIVIGNEVLSGKVEEENARFLTRELRALGVDLLRVCVIRDDIDDIASEVRRMRTLFDYVFTTGGVGPTHDDVTFEGVARGFDVPLVRHAGLEALFRTHYGDRITESVLKMADLPRGAKLVGGENQIVPVIQVENFFVLPGVPEFVQRKFAIVRPLLHGTPIVLRQIYVRVGEDQLADMLRETLDQVPGLEIGSYPRFDRADHRVKITIESRDAASVERGVAFLLTRLSSDAVVRVE